MWDFKFSPQYCWRFMCYASVTFQNTLIFELNHFCVPYCYTLWTVLKRHQFHIWGFHGRSLEGSLLGCVTVLLGMLLPSASKDHISFIFSVKQSEQVSGSTHPTNSTQHPTRTESSAGVTVTISNSRVKNQTNWIYGRVLLDNSHLLWLAFSRQVDQTAVSFSLYPCIMPHASNDQGKKKEKKSYYESHHINMQILLTQFWHKNFHFITVI
jgi:hypothetical protein